ncbi:MAG: 7-carboxy-7-deazaguanine synthase QueE [Thermoplasmata archaeon]
MEERMKVADIYTSIQGEGRFSGRPMVFVRFYGCNLNCSGCDTKLHNYVEMTIDDIVNNINFFDLNDVLLTGGEPLIQPNIDNLIDKLTIQGYRVHIETNGTKQLKTRSFYHVTVSPKSVQDYSFWVGINNADFKIVIGGGESPALTPKQARILVLRLLKQGCSNERIWLMPYGANRKILSYWAKRVFNLALLWKVNYSDRLQIRVGWR